MTEAASGAASLVPIASLILALVCTTNGDSISNAVVEDVTVAVCSAIHDYTLSLGSDSLRSAALAWSQAFHASRSCAAAV